LPESALSQAASKTASFRRPQSPTSSVNPDHELLTHRDGEVLQKQRVERGWPVCSKR
jgi:hypothetical protein